MTDDHSHPAHPSGYEKRDASVWGITLTALAVVALVVFFAVVLDDFFVHTAEEQKYELALKPISEQRLELDALADSLLTTYGVADTTKGTYRIPIERAMELVSEPGTNQGQK